MTFALPDADAWYARNAHALTIDRCDQDHVTHLIADHVLLAGDGVSVCEVGASNGWRLAGLCDRYPQHRYTALDLSPEAVDAGQRLWPHLTHRCAPIDATGEPGASHALVIVSYVLHWVARETLETARAEIDRILKPGGHLVIADFWPVVPINTSFKHRAGLYTYKRDYRERFLEWGYTSIAELPYPSLDSGERCGVFLLRKPA